MMLMMGLRPTIVLKWSNAIIPRAICDCGCLREKVCSYVLVDVRTSLVGSHYLVSCIPCVGWFSTPSDKHHQLHCVLLMELQTVNFGQIWPYSQPCPNSLFSYISGHPSCTAMQTLAWSQDQLIGSRTPTHLQRCMFTISVGCGFWSKFLHLAVLPLRAIIHCH